MQTSSVPEFFAEQQEQFMQAIEQMLIFSLNLETDL